MEFFKKGIWITSLPFIYLILILKILSGKMKAKKYLKNPDDFLVSERYDFIYSLAKWFLYTKNIRTKQLEEIDAKILAKSQLLISNHRSNIDPILIYCFLHLKTNVKPIFVAKKELKDSYFSFIFDLIDTIYIDRDNLRQMVSTIKDQINVLKENKILVIFPEGTRNTEQKLLDFKSGAFESAYKTMSTIQPIVICNQEFYMERSKDNKKNRKEIFIKVLPPYQPSNFVHIDRNIFAKKLQEKMQNEFDKINK